MRELPPLVLATWTGLLLIVAAAVGLRAAYLIAATDDGTQSPDLRVQLSRAAQAELENLLQNLEQERAFRARAPLSDSEEETAHVAPGYPWLVSLLGRFAADAGQAVRWLQCGLGALVALCAFFFGRRAFHSNGVALLGSLFCAVHPFAIVATAELADGVLASFLLAAGLALGTRGSQEGGAFTSLLFGLVLAGLAMVRAALLPFALISLIWFLWRCRQFRWGWFAGLLALLGFGNGLAPWAVRNYRTFGEPLPVVSTAYLHLWMGNNPQATGGELSERELRDSLPEKRRAELLKEENQARRYSRLGRDLVEQIASDPGAAVGRRILAAQAFLLGANWREQRRLGVIEEGNEAAPEWLRANFDLILNASLLLMLTLAILGWRWTYAWAWHARLATLAALWVPLPYVLTHAELLSGPRLPLDTVLLCYAAYALCAWLPEFRRAPDVPATVIAGRGDRG